MNSRFLLIPALFLLVSWPAAANACPPLRMVVSFLGEETEGIAYFRTEAQREPFEIHTSNGRMTYRTRTPEDAAIGDHRSQDGQLADGWYFMVVAPDGRLYGAHEDMKWRYLRYGSGLRHSSFLGGGEVSDAFTVGVKEGQIPILSDDSGHYVPDAVSMHHTLRRLETMGLPLSSSLRVKLRFAKDMVSVPRTFGIDRSIMARVIPVLNESSSSYSLRLIAEQLRVVQDEPIQGHLLSAYLLGGGSDSSLIQNYLRAMVDTASNDPGILDQTILLSIGRIEFYQLLARNSDERLLERWFSTFVIGILGRVSPEKAVGELESILRVRSPNFEATRKVALIQEFPDNILPARRKAEMIQQVLQLH